MLESLGGQFYNKSMLFIHDEAKDKHRTRVVWDYMAGLVLACVCSHQLRVRLTAILLKGEQGSVGGQSCRLHG